MLKIGEFSKLSHLTIKALRFYEKEGILIPSSIDKWSGYRFYETSQLEDAAKIKSYRQLDLFIEEIKAIQSGADAKEFFAEKAMLLKTQKEEIVTMPKANYIAVREKGNPNKEGGAYQQAVGVLYAVAYTLKMSYKTDYKI